MTRDWDAIPRLLHDICDGPHGGFSEEVFYYVAPHGGRLWLCRSCWGTRWIADGRPDQPTYDPPGCVPK